MIRNALKAVLIGVLVSGALYYVWASMQWRQAAQAPQNVNAEVATQDDVPTTGPAVSTAPLVIKTPTPSAIFVQDGTVRVDARLGHAWMAANSGSNTHIALTASTADGIAAKVRVPANVTLVIDRSGSMQGERITSAQAAAEFVLDSLQDGDRIALVTYASDARVDMANVVLTPQARVNVRTAIRGIWVGGGTCVSCGIEMGHAELRRGVADDGVSRLILLSDGQANQGITDIGQLATLTRQVEASGAVVSTVGVGLDYNEDLMTQVAVSGNGNHYFVEDPKRLATTLGEEMNTLRQLLARRVTVTFELASGVRFVRGYDRDFQVVGNQVIVSLGDMPANAERTTLFEVALDPTKEGLKPVTGVRVAYDDLTNGRATQVAGDLAAGITADASVVAKGIDNGVSARVEQAALADALAVANEQIQQGKMQEAEATMTQQLSLSRAANVNLGSAKLDRQLEAFEGATMDMKKPAASTASGKSRNKKKNKVMQRSLAF